MRSLLRNISFFLAAAIFVHAGLFSFVQDVRAQSGAVLKLVPSSGTFFVGKTFDVSIVVDTGPQAINAVAVELRFTPQIIQVTNPAAGSSIVSLWSAPPT